MDSTTSTGDLATGPAARTAARILVVDDVADNRDVLTRRLLPRGFEVVEAAGGDEALALIEAEPFDVVLLDIMMPGTDGVEVLRRVRRTHSETQLPVIMVSAKSQSEDIVGCLELGANDYITKPVDIAVALARINTQLTRRSDGGGESRLRYLAYHDGLTGLLNRTAFREQLAEALRGAEAGAVTLMFMDLDRFKAINDVHGHEAGDRLLGEVAQRLRRVMGPDALLARLGGDEFAAAMSGPVMDQRAMELAERAVEELGQPFSLESQLFQIGVSCGLVSAAACDGDMDRMLKGADLAMYAAKSSGRNRAVRYDPAMLAAQKARSALEIDFRAAVGEGGLELYYQPLIDARTRRVTSFEALLRWPHSGRGMVMPDEFIPVAERTGLIVPLGRWVLQRACAEAARWPEELRVSVNLSPLQFRDPSLLPMIDRVLAETGLAPSRLELEITESALLDAHGRNADILREIRARGVRVAMDDFGTGYSSLAYLQQFRFDKIKIDRRFIENVGHESESGGIIDAIVRLGARIGIETTAEGVETAEQLAEVVHHGCTELQGFYLGRPSDAEATRALIARLPGRS